MNHRGTARLETRRLILRRFEREDAPAMFEGWASDGEVARFLTWPPHASVEVTGQIIDYWIKGYESPDSYNWALELREEGRVIGSLSVVRLDEDVAEAELGWCMGRAWWGRGLMPEAAEAVVRFLFYEVGVERICAKYDVRNLKSGLVMQKLGMRFEGLNRRAFRNNQGVVDTMVYGLLRGEERSNAPEA